MGEGEPRPRRLARASGSKEEEEEREGGGEGSGCKGGAGSTPFRSKRITEVAGRAGEERRRRTRERRYLLGFASKEEEEEEKEAEQRVWGRPEDSSAPPRVRVRVEGVEEGKREGSCMLGREKKERERSKSDLDLEPRLHAMHVEGEVSKGVWELPKLDPQPWKARLSTYIVQHQRGKGISSTKTPNQG